MKTKNLIMVDLIVTALGAALALSNLLPFWVTALLLVAGGCVAAYYMALSEQGRKTIEEMNLLNRAERSLYSCVSQPLILNRLKDIAINWTGADEAGFISYSPEYPDTETPESNKVSEQLRLVMADQGNNFEAIYWTPGSQNREMQSLLDTFNLKELMAIPLQQQDKRLGMLYMYSRSVIHLDRQKILLERLANGAAIALIRQQLLDSAGNHNKAIIESIIDANDGQQPLFAGHSKRVAASAALIGNKLSLSADETTALKYSALLHDIGKIKINEDGAGKEDKSLMEHPVQGAAMLPQEDFFIPVKEAILSHHERYDGQGYPEGLKHNEIPFLARIIAVADIYDALVRLCPEEERLSHEQAVQTIKKATGTIFDPLVVVAFEEVEKEIKVSYANFPEVKL
ncbi:MAG TPA: HD domain-containing phosphohydrolase [Syntrophomonadaceae bacterium]|nr:HD domain-containing phosphohydrolase [Syntrophomonadaceae bacterium]